MVHVDPPLSHYFTPEDPVVVTLCYRGKTASRHMTNVELLISTLEKALTGPKFVFRHINSSNFSVRFEEQIQWVARSHIVISEHGAFQSNMIYMRRGSLFIEMRGPYGHGEFRNFELIAAMFGIYYNHVYTNDLATHRHTEFTIKEDECQKVAEIALAFADQKPYLVNTKPPDRTS
jgi:Glycosyltransferase 61